MHLAALDGQARVRFDHPGSAARRRRAGPLRLPGRGPRPPRRSRRARSRNRPPARCVAKAASTSSRGQGGEELDGRLAVGGLFIAPPGRPRPKCGPGFSTHARAAGAALAREHPGRSASPTGSRSSDRGSALRAARTGLSPTRSARAAARAAFAHSHSVWPVRQSCQATAAATRTSGTTATVSTDGLTRFRASREHIETVPPGGRRDNARALRNGLLVAAVVRPGPEEAVGRERQQREPHDHAGAAGVEQTVRGGERQDSDRQRAVQREPDAASRASRCRAGTGGTSARPGWRSPRRTRS